MQSIRLPRRTLLRAAAGAAAVCALPRLAQAQASPSRPVNLIVRFPAGGGTDAVARPLSAQDVISLSQSGVSPDVITAMQTPPPQLVQPTVMAPATPVIVEQPYYDPYWGPRYCRAPGMSYGVTVVR